MLFTECKTLGDVGAIFHQVEHVAVTYEGGRVKLLTDGDALEFCGRFHTRAVKWRPEYALCSTEPFRNAVAAVVSFIVYPKQQFKHAKPTTPAALAERFNDATPAEMRG